MNMTTICTLITEIGAGTARESGKPFNCGVMIRKPEYIEPTESAKKL